MNTVALITSTALTLIQDIAPLVNDVSTAGKIISALETYLPIVEQFAGDLAAPLKATIATLLTNGALTADQVTALKAMDAQMDAAFDAAAAAYDAAQPTT